jgi:hypothetical protein
VLSVPSWPWPWGSPPLPRACPICADATTSAALSPITRRPEADPGDEALKARLNAWVRDGAGSGAALLPWATAHLPTPLSRLQLPDGQENAVRHFGYRLAGYHQLDERGCLGGILYRIGVQMRPLLWFLPRRPDEPWDDAWLDEVDDNRLAALAPAGHRAARP